MQKRWHYIYLIVYPSLGYKLYYGSRISGQHPHADSRYFGSPQTFAKYNQAKHPEYQADALKVIISAEYCAWTKISVRRLNSKEARFIRHAHAEHGVEMCLNRNAHGRFLLTQAELSAAGKKSAALGVGFHGMSPDARAAARARGGRTNGIRRAKTYYMLAPNNRRKRIHNMTEFCRRNALVRSHMFKVANGLKESYKGWRKA